MTLWEDTVTVYRETREGVSRRVLKHCYYSYTQKLVQYERYKRHHTQSLLIVPGGVDLKAGDRVYPGIGPETVNWDSFLPVELPGVSELGWVRKIRVDGKTHHTEAGG